MVNIFVVVSCRLTWMFFQQMKERYSSFLQRQTNAEENFILGAIAAAGSVCGTFFIRIYTSITLVLGKQLKCTIHCSPFFVFSILVMIPMDTVKTRLVIQVKVLIYHVLRGAYTVYVCVVNSGMYAC